MPQAGLKTLHWKTWLGAVESLPQDGARGVAESEGRNTGVVDVEHGSLYLRT